jgi:TetR/AcrR family transcriptional regulator
VKPRHEAHEPRAPRNAETTRARILDAAEREFAARGFARVQPALIHHYFADKSGLYEAVLDRGLELMHSVSWRVLEGATDVAGMIRGFVEVLIDFYASNEHLLAIVRNETLAGSTLLLDRARERLGPLLDISLSMVEARQQAGEIRSDLTPREIVLAGLSLILYPSVDATVVDALLPPPAGSGDPVTRRKEVVLAMLLSALRPPTSIAPAAGRAAAPAPARRAGPTVRARR